MKVKKINHEEEGERSFVGFMVVLGIVMMVAAFAISFHNGDIKSPSCGGYVNYHFMRPNK